jgi:uncharacterized ubiquitin-like protein YukD
MTDLIWGCWMRKKISTRKQRIGKVRMDKKNPVLSAYDKIHEASISNGSKQFL